MSIYGQSIIKENTINKSINEFSFLSESVVYNEYLNYKAMMEQCSDPSKRELLSEKVDLLLEVSFKDIGRIIKKILEKISNVIKTVIGWFKSIAKNIKSNILSKKTKEVESEIKKRGMMDEDLDGEKSEPEPEPEVSEPKDNESDFIKQKQEKENQALLNIANEAIANKYTFFNMYDYIKKDQSVVKILSNEFDLSIIFNLDEKVDKILSGEHDIVLPEIKEKLANNGNAIINKTDIEKYIEDKLEYKMNQKHDMRSLFKMIDNLHIEHQSEIIVEVLESYEKYIEKLKETDFSKIENLDTKKYEQIMKYVKYLESNSMVLTVISKYTIESYKVLCNTVARLTKECGHVYLNIVVSNFNDMMNK